MGNDGAGEESISDGNIVGVCCSDGRFKHPDGFGTLASLGPSTVTLITFLTVATIIGDECITIVKWNFRPRPDRPTNRKSLNFAT